MAISNATLNQDVWAEIRTTLVAANLYVVTNSETGATAAASINAVYNDKNQTKPQVIIYPISKDESVNKFSSNYGKMLINVRIEAYAGNTSGVDQLADQIEESLRGTIIQGIDLVSISGDYAFVNPNEAKYHYKVMTITYMRE